MGRGFFGASKLSTGFARMSEHLARTLQWQMDEELAKNWAEGRGVFYSYGPEMVTDAGLSRLVVPPDVRVSCGMVVEDPMAGYAVFQNEIRWERG
jgi:hypothetical protein